MIKRRTIFQVFATSLLVVPVHADGISNGGVASPSVLRSSGEASTPENNGLTVDRTGTNDSTSALNTWLGRLVANGDWGELGAGTFKTSAALVTGSGNSLRLGGNGTQSTIIAPTGSTYPAIHVNLGNNLQPSGWIKGIGVVGPSPNPTGQQAGFLIDNTPLFVLDTLDVHNCDIGYDAINNCFNLVGYNLNTSRFQSCNVGISLRAGSQSGSDIKFYNTILTAAIFAVCIAGGGGGYAFYGGQWSAVAASPDDANGVIQIGWNYFNNTSLTGVDNTLFSGISLEGYRGCHGIRAYGETQAKFDTMSFNGSASSGVEAIDIFKGTALNNSIITFDSCNVVGTFTAAKLGSIAGNFGGNPTPLRQTNWYVPPSSYTANGVGGANPLTDITMSP